MTEIYGYITGVAFMWNNFIAYVYTYKGQWDVCLYPIKKVVFNRSIYKNQEKHKCISKDGAFCCSYSGNRLWRFSRWASSLFFNAFTDEAVTTFTFTYSLPFG